MNESAARQVLLMLAIESSDLDGQVVSADDRLHATRTAREMAQWRATETGKDATANLFLQQRAALVIERTVERHPGFRAVAQPASRKLLYLLPFIGFVAGAAIDHIAHPHRIDILSLPLLGIIAWNLLVYLFIVLSPVLGARLHGLTRRLSARLDGLRSTPMRLPAPLLTAATSFAAKWRSAAAPVSRARAACTLHTAAFLFTAGVITSLYLRGLMTQYVVGWESTFLDANQVQAITSTLFASATKVFGLPGFSAEEIASLRFGAQPLGGTGARWVHLYAATLALLVLLPRAALAGVAGVRARYLARRVPVDLQDPYFVRVCAAGGVAPDTAAVLRVLPYSFQLDEARDRGLAETARHLYGDRVRVMLRPALGYGAGLPDLQREPGTITAALFSLAATPEHDTHGQFLRALQQQLGEAPRICVDVSTYEPRLRGQPDGAARVATRCAMWRHFAEVYHLPVTFVDLLSPNRSDLP